MERECRVATTRHRRTSSIVGKRYRAGSRGGLYARLHDRTSKTFRAGIRIRRGYGGQVNPVRTKYPPLVKGDTDAVRQLCLLEKTYGKSWFTEN